MSDSLKHLLFIDIETASGRLHFDDLPDALKYEWRHKAQTKWEDSEKDAPALFFEKAAIFAEFGRIVCISVGCLRSNGQESRLLIRSFADEDERVLLNAFCGALTRFAQDIKGQGHSMSFVGHNIKEFDLPYISRRLIILGMQLPESLQHQGKKPWEIPHIDTMQLWSFGDYKSFTRLALLAEVLGIPSPKNDINGADVSRVFWQEHDLARIVTYCQKDVETTAKVYLRLMGNPLAFHTEILSA